ncbi:MAG: sugar transferase [Sphingobacteriales bacterium]|nr:MAG: sugar transferase [Sphingobacteriales bacterium]TAF81091.1 MAG: sugar transferase [Sphingobacteriales bacterium]
MSGFSPIALFVYNRPEHTRRTLKFLQKNLLADESRLYIFSDAAKTPSQQNAVNQVRQLIKHTTGFKNIHITEQKTNLGLANSIITGVTQLVNIYGKVIVFEDDLLSSKYTLTYFNEALNRYQNQEKLMHISAYMYPLAGADTLPQTFVYRAAHSWGWATWQRAWVNFNPDINHLIAQFDTQKINDFAIDGTMNFWKQMQEFKKGKNNSWAIRWYASIFLKGGLTLNPSKSLVHNIGHDGTGIHSNIEKTYSVTIHQKQIEYFPTLIHENKQAYALIKTFLSKRKGNMIKRVLRFLKNKMG